MQHTLKKLLILSCVLLSVTIFSYSYNEDNDNIKGERTTEIETENKVSKDKELERDERIEEYSLTQEEKAEELPAINK